VIYVVENFLYKIKAYKSLKVTKSDSYGRRQKCQDGQRIIRQNNRTQEKKRNENLFLKMDAKINDNLGFLLKSED